MPSVRGSGNGSRCADGGMRLLVDAQLPPALARWFVSKGHDAVHVFDIEFHRSSDEEIRKFALDNDLILVTKDEDFSSRVWVSGLRRTDLGNNRQLLESNPHRGFRREIGRNRENIFRGQEPRSDSKEKWKLDLRGYPHPTR